MHKIFLIPLATLLFLSCNVNTRSENEPATDTVYIEKENKGITHPPADHGDESGKGEGQPDKPKDIQELPDISGTHHLTLQWISWDRPGKAVIKKTGTNSYSISGSQRGNGQTLKIDGALIMITPLELEFDGNIETGYYGETNESCVKKGKQTFLSTQGRKYWRLQNTASCENDGLTDYVDIYF